MYNLLANYASPNIINVNTPVRGAAVGANTRAKANAIGATGTGGSTTTTVTPNGIGTTFLNLLAQELQNQDPTAPVDSTAMVGQMISLNQLDQLISINQGITGSASSGTTGAAQTPAQTAKMSTALSSPVSTATMSQLPFDPKTMMPAGYGNPSAANLTTFSSSASAMPYPNSTNNTSGGN